MIYMKLPFPFPEQFQLHLTVSEVTLQGNIFHVATREKKKKKLKPEIQGMGDGSVYEVIST